MKPVAQEHPMGCAVACVASCCGLSYRKALSLFKPELTVTKGYYCRDICEAFAKKGKRYAYHRFRHRMQSMLNKPGTIVFIAKSRKYPSGHYLLRTQKGWMNPWINFPSIKPVKAGFQRKVPGKVVWVMNEV